MLTRTVMRVGLVMLMLVSVLTNGVITFAIPTNAASLPTSPTAKAASSVATQSLANTTFTTAAVKPQAASCVFTNTNNEAAGDAGVWGQAYPYGTNNPTDPGNSIPVTVTMLYNNNGTYTQIGQFVNNHLSGQGEYFEFNAAAMGSNAGLLVPGFSFILYFQTTSSATPLYYPNRLDPGSAMQLHFDSSCRVVDDQGLILTGPQSTTSNGWIEMLMLDGAVIGGRLVSSGSFSNTNNPVGLADSDIESASVPVNSGANIKLCAWAANTTLPDPTNCTSFANESNPAGGTDNDGYYLLGVSPSQQTYALLFGANGYRHQAYFGYDFAYPVTSGESLGTVVTATTAGRVAVPTSLVHTSQSEFNGILNGSDQIQGQIADGRGGSCTEGIANATVYAYDASLPSTSAAIAITGTDGSGNFTLGGLSPGRSYTVTVQPPAYYGGGAVPFTGSNCSSLEFQANYVYPTVQTFSTQPSSQNGDVDNVGSIGLPLGSGIQGTISTATNQFTVGQYVEVAVWPHGQEDGNAPLFTLEEQITQTETSFTYTFPRLLDPGQDYDLEFAPLGTGNYRVAWYDGSTYGSQSPANAQLIASPAGQYFPANIVLQVGQPLKGKISGSHNEDLANLGVTVLVQVYEASTKQFVTGFQIDKFTGNPNNGTYNWVSPALSSTDSYYVQFIPSPGNTSGYNSAFYNLNSSTGVNDINQATPVAPQSNTSVNITLQAGGEYIVHVTANNISFGGVQVVLVNAVSITTTTSSGCGTTVFAKQITRSADGIADFKDLAAGTYCLLFNPPGNLASDFQNLYSQPLTTTGQVPINENLSVGQVSITGKLYSSAGANSLNSNDFKGWSVALISPPPESIISLCPVTTCGGGMDASGSLNYTITVSTNASSQYGKVEAYFVPPSSGTNFVPEYHGNVTNGHSPVTDPTANDPNAGVDISLPMTGTTKVVKGVDGVFAPGAIVTLHTQDIATSSPIAGVPVGLYTGTPPDLTAVYSATTTAKGDWTSDLLPANTTYYAYAAGASVVITPGYISQWYTNQYSPGTATGISLIAGQQREIVFGLPRQAGIVGQVQGSLDGINNVQPLSGVTVNFYQAGSSSALASVVTGADGGYAVQLPPGSYQIQFSAVISGLTATGYYCSTASGYITQGTTNSCTNVATQQGSSTNNNTVILSGYTNNGAIEGQVTGSINGQNPQPVAGVTVSAPGASYQATTDANGIYTLFVQPGTYKVHFTTSQFNGVNVYYSQSSGTGTTDSNSASNVSVSSIGYPPSATNINVQISGYTNNGSISGNVVGSVDGTNPQALAGATVQVYSSVNSATPIASAQTDSSGNYTVFVAPGSYKVNFTTTAFGGRTNWYNNQTAFTSAATVQVTLGQDTPNINSNLSPSTSVACSNNCSSVYLLPFVANNANGFTTYLAFQNVGTATANVSITYFDSSGNPISSASVITQVAQYGETLPPNPFASGSSGAGIIVSDQPLSVIVPESTPYGGSAYAVGSGSSNSLIAPFALHNAFGDFTTQLNIFNGSGTAATANVTFYGTVGTSTTLVSSTTSVTIPPYQTANLNQSSLQDNFSGWAQITGSTNSLVAQVLEQSPSTKFVAIANAVSNPSPTEYAPAIFNSGYGAFYTGANIINPNPNPVTVSITYYDLSANATTTSPFVISAYGVQSIFDGATSGPGLPSGGLPKPFIGSVSVSATGGNIAMSVNENGGITGAGNSRSGTYAAIASGSSTVGLPVISNGGYTYVTGDTILNTSSQSVNATITYYDLTGKPVSGATKSFTIPGHGSQAYYQGDGSLPNNFYGTAVVTETSGPANSLIITTNAQNVALFYTYSEPSS